MASGVPLAAATGKLLVLPGGSAGLAAGWAIMVSDASPRAAAASDSPSALMIFARFSRSASACLAMARFTG